MYHTITKLKRKIRSVLIKIMIIMLLSRLKYIVNYKITLLYRKLCVCCISPMLSPRVHSPIREHCHPWK